ncbi:MAG: hypothetical protein VX589_11305 [Myxococcota bacterium]|nr:hypothetical protein [Myxococcota bacterium]
MTKFNRFDVSRLLIQSMVALCWLAATLLMTSCTPKAKQPNRTVRVKPPLASEAPRVQMGRAPSTAAERFPVGEDKPLPSLRMIGRAPGQVPETPKPKTVEIEAKLLASSVASGGDASDWPGLKPGERFFRAEYRAQKDGQTNPIPFRIKTKNAEMGSKLLGQTVKLTGHWVFSKTTAEEAANFLTKQAGIRLVPRRGQDLYEAAQKGVDERLKRIDERTKRRLNQRIGPTKDVQTRLPLFFAEQILTTKTN